MIIAFPHPPGHGGPGSFQSRFEHAVKQAGWEVVYAPDNVKPDVVMVVGGTKKLIWLWQMRQAEIPIVYRLDGINWLHRKKKVGVRKYTLGEVRNLLNKCIHAFLADHVIYQSKFVQAWWEKEGWRKHKKTSVIYNGVDLSEFRLQKSKNEPDHLLCLEGNIDYSPYAIELINELTRALRDTMRVIVYGSFERQESQKKLISEVDYRGRLERSELHKAYHNTIYLSLDVNAACPNTVVEALASGAPVVGFDTGALKELVGDEAGIIVDYGSNPWSLQAPNTNALLKAIERVKANYQKYAHAARQRAEGHFDMSEVSDQYLSVISNLKSKG